MKLARCSHPRSPTASELIVWRRQSYAGRRGPMAVKATTNRGPARAPHATRTRRSDGVHSAIRDKVLRVATPALRGS